MKFFFKFIFVCVLIFASASSTFSASRLLNGAKGTVLVTNMSSIVKEPGSVADEVMELHVNVDLAYGGPLFALTIPNSSGDVAYNVDLYTSDGQKIWASEKVNLVDNGPEKTKVDFKLNQSIGKDLYLDTYPDPNLPGNLVRVYIRGSQTNNVYYESDPFKLFEYNKVLKTEILSLSNLAPLKGSVLKVNGTAFTQDKIKRALLNDVIIPHEIISSELVELTIPSTIPSGVYEVSLSNDNGDKYVALDKITIANITINSLTPADITQGSVFSINGAGFFKDKIVALYVGNNEMNWETVNDLKLNVSIASDFTPGVYEVVLYTNDQYKITSPQSLTVRDKSSTNTNTTGGGSGGNTSGGNTTGANFPSFGGIVPRCNVGDIDVGTGEYVNKCDFNYFMKLINNVIDFLLIYFATPLAAIIFAYAGFLYLTSGGNTSKASKAKSILGNLLFGYLIALAAWLIVNTILTTLGFDEAFSFLR